MSVAYNLDGETKFEAFLDLKTDLAYTKFMRWFAGQASAPITKKEHTSSTGSVIISSTLDRRKSTRTMSPSPLPRPRWSWCHESNFSKLRSPHVSRPCEAIRMIPKSFGGCTSIASANQMQKLALRCEIYISCGLSHCILVPKWGPGNLRCAQKTNVRILQNWTLSTRTKCLSTDIPIRVSILNVTKCRIWIGANIGI